MKRSQRNEKKAYTLSFFGALVMALLGFGFAYLTSSDAILLDGVFSSINMIMIATTLYVCIKILPLVNHRFQFGLSQMEPIINIAKACLFVSVIVFASYSAIIVILKGGRQINFDLGILYALVATIGCLIIAIILVRMNKAYPTPLLSVETKGWMVDTALSSAILFVFFISKLIETTQWEHYLPYVDPCVLLTISLIVIPIPIAIFKDNFLELLTSAPSIEKQQEIETILTKVLSRYAIDDFAVRSGKTGRQLDIWVMCLRKRDVERSMHDLDEIRRALYTAFEVPNSHIHIYIEATADEKIYHLEIAYP